MTKKNYYRNFDFKTAGSYINLALKEDLGRGDVTTDLLIPAKNKSRALLVLKEHGVIAGIELFKLVYKIVDPKIIIRTSCPEGVAIKGGTKIAEIVGNSRSILKAERLSLNIIQRMSGIATATFCIKKRLANDKIKLVDTRKTTPNFRIFEKLAVKIGGGDNHRFGLYDMILIKDNHIEANNGVENTLIYLKKVLKKKELKVEIEVKNIVEFKKVLELGRGIVDIVMLDNFKIEDVQKAAKLNRGAYKIEISGGVNHENIMNYGKIKGIDIISVGAITHSVRSLDLSLEFIS
ncbi:MAG: carboxylating nicotinate-nucleotide diphosphorylase [Ignavibacteria bacterium]|nr:carboxylating nicotinate-nucleotide diphosphorylase [Ignavibacteria bacterium]